MNKWKTIFKVFLKALNFVCFIRIGRYIGIFNQLNEKILKSNIGYIYLYFKDFDIVLEMLNGDCTGSDIYNYKFLY